ncbi:MAG: hypothetical protein ACK2TU_09260, partial [Anaerolineales bacterium]
MKKDQSISEFLFKRIAGRIILSGYLLISFFIYSCSTANKPVVRFSVTENAGEPRPLEFVQIDVPSKRSYDTSQGISIREEGTEKRVLGQVLETKKLASGKTVHTCLFPVSVDANATKTYEVLLGEGELYPEQLTLEGDIPNVKIENKYFIADLTDIKATPENGLGSGQLAGLVLKQFNNQLLERFHINMHWAPNFQREGPEYKTFGHILNPDSASSIKGPYYISIYKSGHVDGYEQIKVTCKYQFYAGLPYFIFSSTIEMVDDIELWLLRNDEMTMDSLFTHVMYLQPDGKMGVGELYTKEDIEALEKDPIKDDAPWVCFFNSKSGFGFGSIRLEYDNTNTNGQESPLYEPHTKITVSVNNGRYWNRRLINDHNTLIPAGSRYAEKNAYLVFKVNK